MRPSRMPLPDSDRAPGHVEECTVRVDHLEAVHRTLTRFWGGFSPPLDERWRMLFEIAVAEVAANILEHAVPPQITLTLRAQDGSLLTVLIDTGMACVALRRARRLVNELT